MSIYRSETGNRKCLTLIRRVECLTLNSSSGMLNPNPLSGMLNPKSVEWNA